MQLLARLGAFRLSAFLCVTAFAASCSPQQPPAAAPQPAVPAGTTWDSMKVLPDWHGAWTKPEPLDQSPFVACCIVGSTSVPLTPRYLALRDRAAKSIQRGVGVSNNIVTCQPDGVPSNLLHGLAHEYLFTPGQVTMLLEDGEVRRIYTDGRQHQPLSALHTSVEGDSIGHWEGHALLIDTLGMSTEANLFLTNGMKVGKNTRVVERIALQDPDTLRIETTITDPEIFTAPYTYALLYTRLLRETGFDIGCGQSNRDNDRTIDLTPPPEDD